MAEESLIKIEPDAHHFRPANPIAKMLRSKRVAVDPGPAGLGIRRMKTQAVFARNERKRLCHIGTQFIRSSSLARVIASDCHTASQCFPARFESSDIIAL